MIRALSIVTLSIALAACAREQARTADAPPETTKAGCVSETGSRIEKKEGEACHAGRTYTREDLERSGGATTGEALRRSGN